MRKSAVSRDTHALRHAAEALLPVQAGASARAVGADAHKLLHELQVHQIELEMQNAELVRARAEIEEGLQRYIELYDFAPVAYLTLDHEGIVRNINLTGADRSRLVGRPFGLFVAIEERAAFADFVARAVSAAARESCELRVHCQDDALPHRYIRIEAVSSESGSAFRAAVIDLTERRRAEVREQTHSRVLDMLAHGAMLTEILETVAEMIEHQIEGARCAVTLTDTPRQRLVLGVAPSLPTFFTSILDEGGLDEGATPCALAASRGERVVYREITGQACRGGRFLAAAAAVPLRSCWAEPIVAAGMRSGRIEHLGSLTVFWPEVGACVGADEALIVNAARLCALAIERKRSEEELQLASAVYQSIREGVMVTDEDNRILAVNPAFSRVTGYAAHEVIGENPRLLSSGRQDIHFYKRMRESLLESGRWQGEIWNRRKNGEEYVEWLSITVLHDADEKGGDNRRHIALISDITEQKRAQETILRQANYDALTLLPNRRLFSDRLRHEISKTERDGQALALLFIDLDHFKEVNDALGHDTGDRLLVEAAGRIGACVRAIDTVARLGGDEFTVILSDLADTRRVGEVAQNIVDSLTQPFVVGDEVLHISASIGITLFPLDASEMESLLKNADQAMYAAKAEGRNRFAYFTPSLQVAAQERLQLIKDLRVALAGGQFEVHFQSIVELASSRVVKAEALLRWQHPRRGMVDPVEFIATAEDVGLIGAIGDWVFKEAAHWARRWRDESGHDIQVSVNVSPAQFAADGSDLRWGRILANSELDSSQIVIEVTEGLLLENFPAVTDKLRRLRQAGIAVAIDDFGTGYSALSYLKNFDIDFLKIDRAFVRDLATDPNDRVLVEAIIVMAHKMGIRVIAEGVETVEQRDILLAAGCDFGQGYLFARPMPPESAWARWSSVAG